MNNFSRFILLLFSVISVQCNTHEKPAPTNNNPKTETIKSDGRSVIESGHHKAVFLQNEAIGFDFELTFRGKIRAQAKQYLSTTTDYIRFDYSDGKQLLFDGKNVLLSPDTAVMESARFDIFTWSYFFALPYKLSDPGAHWEELDDKTVNGIAYDVGKLTFGKNVGDAPDDWYIIYTDKHTHLIKAAAYIVTFSKDAETAEQNPHAIVYNSYSNLEGIPLSNDWSFHNWNETDGWTDTLGIASLSDFQFLKRSEIEVNTESGFQLIGR